MSGHCCSTSGWGAWQWFQYSVLHRSVCDINCGNCLCVYGGGSVPRGSGEAPAPTSMKVGNKMIHIIPEGDPRAKYIDRSFRERLGLVVSEGRIRRSREG